MVEAVPLKEQLASMDIKLCSHVSPGKQETMCSLIAAATLKPI